MSEERKGEVLRLRHQIENLRGLIAGLEQTFEHDWPASESAQAVVDSAARVLTHAARLDAFAQVEQPYRTELRTAHKAIRAALATWCPTNPGGDGADGDTYQLCREALEGES